MTLSALCKRLQDVSWLIIRYIFTSFRQVCILKWVIALCGVGKKALHGLCCMVCKANWMMLTVVLLMHVMLLIVIRYIIKLLNRDFRFVLGFTLFVFMNRIFLWEVKYCYERFALVFEQECFFVNKRRLNFFLNRRSNFYF